MSAQSRRCRSSTSRGSPRRRSSAFRRPRPPPPTPSSRPSSGSLSTRRFLAPHFFSMEYRTLLGEESQLVVSSSACGRVTEGAAQPLSYASLASPRESRLSLAEPPLQKKKVTARWDVADLGKPNETFATKPRLRPFETFTCEIYSPSRMTLDPGG